MKDEKAIETKIGEMIITLDYMKRDIVEIKSDIKEMKTDFVTRKELDSSVAEHKTFVTKTEFGPYKAALTATASIMLGYIINSIVGLIKF